MAFREGSARSGLQVLLETCGLLFGREFDHDRQGPRAVFDGVAARTAVVPLQAIVDVARQADVMAVRIGATPKDVDETFANALHAEMKAILGPILCGTIPPVNVGLRRTSSSRLRRFCNAPAGAMLRKLPRLGFARVDER